ncbi:MAG: hypothetical protein WD270_11100 [Acetobacterales bacterium]
MSNTQEHESGATIQAYVRARMQGHATAADRARVAEMLPSCLRARIDALGVDRERLLAVAPEDVTAALEALEREAELEDAGIRPRSVEVRAREERWIHGQTHSPHESRRRLPPGLKKARSGRRKAKPQ